MEQMMSTPALGSCGPLSLPAPRNGHPNRGLCYTVPLWSASLTGSASSQGVWDKSCRQVTRRAGSQTKTQSSLHPVLSSQVVVWVCVRACARPVN